MTQINIDGKFARYIILQDDMKKYKIEKYLSGGFFCDVYSLLDEPHKCIKLYPLTKIEANEFENGINTLRLASVYGIAPRIYETWINNNSFILKNNSLIHTDIGFVVIEKMDSTLYDIINSEEKIMLPMRVVEKFIKQYCHFSIQNNILNWNGIIKNENIMVNMSNNVVSSIVICDWTTIRNIQLDKTDDPHGIENELYDILLNDFVDMCRDIISL